MQAVASPGRLLDESKGHFALGSSLKECSNGSSSLFAPRDFTPNFHFSPSSGWSATRYGCPPCGEFDDGAGADDDEASRDGSEEFFPEPDPSDPADGGLPCLARCSRHAWGVAVLGQ